ncbi:hypothetical protein [Streptomyces sp. NPDC056682]|uniref:hypothetical protein n=1 Tax=Streptomyces sp. NPDC056682 TaxID=3345909 RepID=UPI0036868224
MEILLTVVGEHLLEAHAEVSIDLYVDEEIADPEASRLFEAARQEAVARNPNISKRKSPYMGFSLDLSQQKDMEIFTRLSCWTIGSEAFVGNKIVFSSIENQLLIWMDIPGVDAEELLATARRNGAAAQPTVS